MPDNSQSLQFNDPIPLGQPTVPHERRLPNGCQIEKPFTDAEWNAFVECAKRTWQKGEFIHNEFYDHRLKHPEVSDADITNAMRKGASLVAYQDDGMERIALYDRSRRSIVVVAVLTDGIMTAYEAGSFEKSLLSKTDVRWLRKLT